MTSAQEGGGGSWKSGQSKRAQERRLQENADKGGRGSKNLKVLLSSLMEGSLHGCQSVSQYKVPSNLLNGSLDNGTNGIFVQVSAGPILVLTYYNVMVNGSIRLLVEYLAGPDVEPFSGFDCSASKA